MNVSSSLALSPEDRALIGHVDELGRQGAQGLPALLQQLTHGSWAVRRAVVAALASQGDVAIPSLVSILETQRDHEGRLAAVVDTLVASRGAAEEAALTLARGSDSVAVLCDAAQILGRRRAHSAIPELVKLSVHPDDNVAVAAIEALGRIGGVETVDALIKAVEAKSFFRTFPAVDALGRTGDPRAVKPLTALLADPLYAPEAARSLGRTGLESAIAPVAGLLLKPSTALVRTAAIALAELRERAEAQYGETESLVRALSANVDPSVASGRIIEALAGVVPSELAAIARVLGWIGDEVAIAQLVVMLMGDPPVAAASADALRRLGARATPQILASIRASGSAERLRLLPLVGFGAGSIDDLIICLDDPDNDVRARASEALARLGNPSAVTQLFRLLGDRDVRVSQAAAAAIQSLGSLETKRLALEQARSSDTARRRAALRIISYFGYPEGLDVLIAAIDEDDEKVREAAIYGLPLVDDPKGTAALLAAAKHTSAKTRAAVMRALGQTERRPSVVAALKSGIADEDAWTRYYACQSLGRLRVDDAAAEVVALMDDPSGQVRVAAVEALAHLTQDDARSALESAARSSDSDMRRAALVGLGIAKRPTSVAILRQAASAEEASTRLVAIASLSAFDSPEVVPTLAHAVSDPDEGVRSAAIGYLSTRPGHDATSALLSHLDNAAVYERILEALAVAPDERIDGILDELETADADDAPRLIAALVRMRRASSQAAIASSLGFENVNARRSAAAAFASLGTSEARDALSRVAGSDPDPEVRRICDAALR